MRDSITLFSFFHNKYNMIKIYRYFLPKNFPFYKFVLTGRENSCWKKLAILWHTKILDPLTNPKVNIKFSDRKKWWKKWNDAFWQIHISRNSISNYCNLLFIIFLWDEIFCVWCILLLWMYRGNSIFPVIEIHNLDFRNSFFHLYFLSCVLYLNLSFLAVIKV